MEKFTKPTQVILFGDSITQFSFNVGGWGARVADHYQRRADVLCRGFSGYNSRQAATISYARQGRGKYNLTT